LAAALIAKGEKLICDGTDTHLVMWDLRPHGLTGSKVEKILDLAHITTNKNSVVGDKSALTPGGIRLGTPALTTRGMLEADMELVADFLHRTIVIALRIQETSGKKLVDFLAALDGDEELKALGDDVQKFARGFSIPGI
jgi:glycine hydroxymethyltransferase